MNRSGETKRSATATLRTIAIATACFLTFAGCSEVAEWSKTPKERLDDLRAKAIAGDANAQDNLGTEFFFENPTEAVKWSRKAAEQGNRKAQSRLGFCYTEGRGVTKNPAEAVKWYRMAAEQGYAEAQYHLGRCYRYGEGVAEDAAEGVKWFRKAAEQGETFAQESLGGCYSEGDGVEADPTEAIKWYKKAAKRGTAWWAALYCSGTTETEVEYEIGRRTKNKPAAAVKWYRMAAEQGHAEAQYCLARCYWNGEGVTKNFGDAVMWGQKAAEQGHALAQFSLGGCFVGGEGVPKNHVEAYKWLNLAAAQGNDDAKKQRDDLELRMSRDQIAEAQRLSAEFKPRKSSP